MMIRSVRPTYRNLRINYAVVSHPGGGVLSGKGGTAMCGPDRVLLRSLMFTNGPFFI